MKLGMLAAVVGFVVVACTPGEKRVARTVIDLADDQCVNVVPLVAGDAAPVTPICVTLAELRAVTDQVLAMRRAAAGRADGGAPAGK